MKLLQFSTSSSYFFSHHLFALRVLVLCVLVMCITDCGGGGSGSTLPQQLQSGNSWQAGVFKDSSTFANKCATPLAGDKKGTVLDENNFLRSWSNETYLWYSEIVDVNPANDQVPTTYFQKLKTTAKTPSGKDKDYFHFSYNTAEWNDLTQGVDTGYGVEWVWVANIPPRNVFVSYTEPGFSAATQGLQRGAKIIRIDGADFINGNDVATLNAGMFPDTQGESHTFEIQDYGSSTTHNVVLTSAKVTKTEVQNVKTITTSTGKVGYFQFNDHLGNAEQGLIAAVTQFRDASISDLIVDMRYNGGGYLSVASELAYMIAGSSATSGKTFEKLVFNDKSPEEPNSFQSLSNSHVALPTLNLSRVFVITTGDTCSASESVINSLRGVNVEVIQIGSTTCGKPYGFLPQDNCSNTYFTIQFKGANDKGYGDYADGFVPSAVDDGENNIKGCALGDDFTHLLGDSAEKNLATALHYRETGSCDLPVGSANFKLQKPSAEDVEDLSDVQATLGKGPGLTNRFINR